MPVNIQIYDTTLRDGAQAQGISFSPEDKKDILIKRDEFGADFVEGGWPGSNPKDDEFFQKAGELRLENARLVAFGSTRKHGSKASEDSNLLAISRSSAGWACIFGKSWDFHVTDALRIPLEDNLEMIRDSVSFLRSTGMHVMFDAEHFFDGYRANREYALSALAAAAGGGAEWLVLCDTNGGSMPEQVAEAVRDVVPRFGVPVGIHCHNDSGLATACSLAAVDAGATMVQGTVNGIGERCGNADLCSVIPNLMIKKGRSCPKIDLKGLTRLSRFVGETANITDLDSLPYVGEKAFAHKGGVHVSAIQKDPRTYEHITPESVGNRRRILVSDMSGRASIVEKLKEFGMAVESEESNRILTTVKYMESKGYQFEGADASFELLVKRAKGEVDTPFEVVGFRLFMDEVGRKGFTSEASVKVVDRYGNVEHTASDGNGPVNALDNALRKAIGRFFPVLNDIRLTDYKVRVLDEKSATASSVRVLIRSTDGKHSWTTVGVSDNVIEASMTALVDSMEYAILRSEGRC